MASPSVSPPSRDSLRHRLSVLVALGLTASCVVATLLTWLAHTHQRDALVRDLQGVSRAMTGLIEKEFSTRERLLRLLAASPTLRDGDLAGFYERAAGIARGSSEWIVLVELDGQQLINTRTPHGEALGRMEFQSGVTSGWKNDQSVVSDLIIGTGSQTPVVAISVPVFIDGELRYGLASVVTPGAFLGSLDLSQISPGYVMALFDHSGTIVARTPSGEKYIGRKVMPDILAAALSGRPVIIPSVTLEGIAVLSTVTSSAQYGWGVAIGAPRKILSRATTELIVLSLAATIATLAVIGGIAWRMLRDVVRDVRTLEGDAEKFARGILPPQRSWSLAETHTAAQALRRTLTQLHTELRHRSEAEAALRLVEQRFRLATNTEVLTLFEQDRELRYTWLYPLHPEHRHALDRTDLELVPLGEDSAIVRLKREVLATGESRRGEVDVRIPSGVRHYSLFVTPRRDARGDVTGVAGVALDITDRKEAEQALARAQEDLLRANAELESKVRDRTASMADLLQQMEEFTYSVSHDLRAPIRAMTSFSGVLLEDHADRLEPDARTALERIVTNGQKMDRLINDLLAFSRVSREVVELRPLSLHDAVQDAIRESLTRTPSATFVVDSPLPPVLAHPTLLSQVLNNLLGNAAKFVAPGVEPVVRLSCRATNDRACLLIRDNGIGVPPELQSRLFRVFERLHANQGYDGTGIGLAIVRRAVERMGGRVGMESHSGGGSCFWIELAIAPTPPTDSPKSVHREEPGTVGRV